MFDFEVGEVQFGLAAGEQRHARPVLRETDRQALADAAAGARDQYPFVLDR